MRLLILAFYFAFDLWNTFTTSTIGTITAARRNAVRYSLPERETSENTPLSAGTRSIGIVSTKVSIIAAVRNLLCFSIVKIEPLRLLIFHAWNISQAESVMNAIVVPASDED